MLEGATEDEAVPQSQSALGHLKQLEREEWRARKKRQRDRQKAVQQGQDPQTPGCTTADRRQTAIELQREQWKQQKRQQRERQRAAKQGQAAANSVPFNLQPDPEHLEELKRKQWREKKQRQRANKRAALQNEVPQAQSPRSANPECTQPQSNTSERTIRRHAAKISDAILAIQDDDVAALAMKKALNRKEFKHIRATLGMNANKEQQLAALLVENLQEKCGRVGCQWTKGSLTKTAYQNTNVLLAGVLGKNILDHRLLTCVLEKMNIGKKRAKLAIERGAKGVEEWGGERVPRCDRLSMTYKHDIQFFWKQNTREASGMNDTVKHRTGPNAYVEHQRHLQEATSLQLYTSFRQQRPDITIGFSVFQQLKPFFVKKVALGPEIHLLLHTMCQHNAVH